MSPDEGTWKRVARVARLTSLGVNVQSVEMRPSGSTVWRPLAIGMRIPEGWQIRVTSGPCRPGQPEPDMHIRLSVTT